MDYDKEALKKHEEWAGKLSIKSKAPLETKDDLSIAYTPGVAAPCLKIHENPADVYKYTGKGNTVAVISDGSAVLGLGNIGAAAGLPVMEGKCVLFNEFAGIDAIPLVLNTQDVDELVNIIAALEPNFGGINLEDIAAPRCFEVEKRLKEKLNIPVFHDDQHGTAVVVCSALVNALRLSGKENPEIVINGAGSAGVAIAKLILMLGLGQVTMLNSKGILDKDVMKLNKDQLEIYDQLNPKHKKGGLKEALAGADVLIGVSVGHVADQDMIRSMNPDPIVFAMANPVPEIEPQDALDAGAFIVGTGRSDHANQVNNVLCFPGIFRGALDARATEINDEMKKAAVYALADLIDPADLRPDYVIVSALDKRAAPAVAKAVAKAAVESGAVQK